MQHIERTETVCMTTMSKYGHETVYTLYFLLILYLLYPLCQEDRVVTLMMIP